MKNNEIELKSLKELFDNDEEFLEACNDAFILDELKTPTKFSIFVEDLEKKLKKTLKTNTFTYKRYLYKHILELEKFEKKV